MVPYFIKMIACSGLLYAFYFFLLQKEKMLVFNRFYLLGAVVVSFLIPLILFRITIEAMATPKEVIVPPSANSSLLTVKQPFVTDLLPALVYAFVLLISLLLFLRLVYRIWILKQKIRKQGYRPFYEARIILSAQNNLPHSFLNYIFLNSKQFELGKIDTAILEHELAHVREKHSVDVLLIELAQAVCWFNPFIWLYKRSVQLNHEFLADHAVVKRTGNVQYYQRLLLKNVYVNNSIPLASSFYFFTTKKRLLMLQRHQSKFAVLKALLIIPLMGALIGIFSEKVYSQKEMKRFTPPKIVKDLSENDILEYKGIMARDYSKASKGYKMDKDDYNRAKYLYEHMTSEDAKTVVNFKKARIFVLPTIVRSDQVERPADLYSNKMTNEQKASVHKMPPPPPPTGGPSVPPPPPPFARESQFSFDKWPVIIENWKGGNDVTVGELKNAKLPENAKNLVFKAKNGTITQAVIVYEGFKSKIVDLSTNDKKAAFEANYGTKVP